jgi:hypothetical protein
MSLCRTEAHDFSFVKAALFELNPRATICADVMAAAKSSACGEGDQFGSLMASSGWEDCRVSVSRSSSAGRVPLLSDWLGRNSKRASY